MLQLRCGCPAALQRHAKRGCVVMRVATCFDPVVSTTVTQREQQQQQQPQEQQLMYAVPHPDHRRTRKHSNEHASVGLTVEHIEDGVVLDELSSTFWQQQQEPLLKQAYGHNPSELSTKRSQLTFVRETLVHTHSRRRRRRSTNGSDHRDGSDSTHPNSSSHPRSSSGRDGTAFDDGVLGDSSSSSKRFRRQHSRPTRSWTPFHAKLLHCLRSQQLLPQHARVLVAVSGGQDSMAMVRLLHDISTQQHWPLQLVVGHCDHRIRPDSAQNAAHVQQWCQQQGLQYRQAVADRQQGDWSEAAARDWRHQQLTHMAQEAGCGYVALGHTATERAETVLFNLIRGAGIIGLGAMGWSRCLTGGMQLVRPLLGFERNETLKACVLTHTEVYADTTNMDQRYMRNRLRLSVFPLLTSINSAAVAHLCSVAETAHLEGEFVSSVAALRLSEALLSCAITRPAAAEQSGTQQMAVPQHLQGRMTPAAAAGPASEARLQAASPKKLAAAGAIRATARGAAAGGDDVVGMPIGATPCMVGMPRISARDVWKQQMKREDCDLHPEQSGQYATLPNAAADTSHPLVEQQVLPQTVPKQALLERVLVPRSCRQLLSVDALQVLVLELQHPALQRRVVHMWLTRQADGSVKASQVKEVLKLLGPACTTGDKTSTLWGRSCVLRYQKLLLLLDLGTAQQVLLGELQVHPAPPASTSGAASTLVPASVMRHAETPA